MQPAPQPAPPASTTPPPTSSAPPPAAAAPIASDAGPSVARTACPSKVPSYAALADPPPPPHWVRAAVPTTNSETLRCANLSRHEWIIGANGDPAPAPPRAGDALPFKPDPKIGMRGAAHVRKVDEGLLVGFDAGEWGGALFFTAPDGGHPQKLADGNVVGFVDLGGEPVALTGLAHLGVSEGKVLHLARAGVGAWLVNATLDLGAAVQAFAPETRDTALVLTTSGLYRVTACGDVSLVAPARYDVLYPGSMTVDGRGLVTIGMRHFVVRWIPQGNGAFREEWLTRDDCTILQLKKFECMCRG